MKTAPLHIIISIIFDLWNCELAYGPRSSTTLSPESVSPPHNKLSFYSDTYNLS
jgi:hypothetical protein